MALVINQKKHTLSIEDNGDGTLEVYLVNDTPVAGFQFDISGITITGASGGSAADAGFMISSSASTVLGFSLSGATIPAGEGVLVNVTHTGFIEACIEDLVLSDADGNSINTEIGDCIDVPWGGDACTMPDLSLHVTEEGSVLYTTSSSIGGFQFNVDGASILSGSGGEAGAAGFTISTSATTVLGFSLSGATIDGCGTLVELELDGVPSGLSEIVISDAFGMALGFEYFSGGESDVEGCMDAMACNYNPDANVDDGSCIYYDCAGECDGGSVIDGCSNSLITLKLYSSVEDTEYNVSTDSSGSCSDSDIDEMSVLGKALVGEEDIILTSFTLQQNYPNPFNPTTTINFNVQVDGIVTLKIYDITGRLVKTLVNNEFRSAGNEKGYDVMWDGTDNFGVGVSAGLYLYNIHTADMSVTKKMIYMK